MDKKREQVPRACQRCASSKRKCSGSFPCVRCIRLGNSDSCFQVRTKRDGEDGVDGPPLAPPPSSITGASEQGQAGGWYAAPPARGGGRVGGGHRVPGASRGGYGYSEGAAPTILGAHVIDSYVVPNVGGGGGGGRGGGPDGSVSDGSSKASASVAGGGGGGTSSRKRRVDRLSRDAIAAHEDYADGTSAGGPHGGYRESYFIPGAPTLSSMFYDGLYPSGQHPQGHPHPHGHGHPHGPPAGYHGGHAYQGPSPIQTGGSGRQRRSMQGSESGGETSVDDDLYGDGFGGGALSGVDGDVSEAESEGAVSHTGMSMIFSRAAITTGERAPLHHPHAGQSHAHPSHPHSYAPAHTIGHAHGHGGRGVALVASGVRHSKVRRIEADFQPPGGSGGGSSRAPAEGLMEASVDLLLRASNEAHPGRERTLALREAAGGGGGSGSGTGSGGDVAMQADFTAGDARPTLQQGGGVGAEAYTAATLQASHNMSIDPYFSAFADTPDLDSFGDNVAAWRVTYADPCTCTAEASPEGSYARVGAKHVEACRPFKLEANDFGCALFNVGDDQLQTLSWRDINWIHPADFFERQKVAEAVLAHIGTYYVYRGQYFRTHVALLQEEDEADLPPGRVSFSAFNVVAGAAPAHTRAKLGSFTSDFGAPAKKVWRQETSYEIFSAEEHVYISYWSSGHIKCITSLFTEVTKGETLRRDEFKLIESNCWYNADNRDNRLSGGPETATPAVTNGGPANKSAYHMYHVHDLVRAAMAMRQANDMPAYYAIMELVNNPPLPRTTAYSRGESFSELAGPSGPSSSGSIKSLSASRPEGMVVDQFGLRDPHEEGGSHSHRRVSNASYNSAPFAYGYGDAGGEAPTFNPFMGGGGGHAAPTTSNGGWHHGISGAGGDSWVTGVAGFSGPSLHSPGLPLHTSTAQLTGPASTIAMARSPSEQALARQQHAPGGAAHSGAPLPSAQPPSAGTNLSFTHHNGSFSGRMSGDFASSVSFDGIMPAGLSATLLRASEASVGPTVLSAEAFPSSVPIDVTAQAADDHQRTVSSSSMGLPLHSQTHPL